MAWFWLIVAGILEVVWASNLKATAGFTRLGPTLIFLGALFFSMLLLGLAVRTIPTGTGYAIWTGIGAVGTVIAGILLYGEPANPSRLICVALIVLGILGLKISSP
jgi:quaternary ammonium compound-resistance protein SugE